MAKKGRSYPTWLYSAANPKGVLVHNAEQEDLLEGPQFDNPNLGKPRPDQKGNPLQDGQQQEGGGFQFSNPTLRRAKAGVSPTGHERRSKPERRQKAGVSPTAKERRIFPKVA
jgi:hypothetical protein